MALGDSLIVRIDGAVARYGRGRTIPWEELTLRLSELGIAVDDDFAQFVGRWGRCFVGVPVHAWDNAGLLGHETCIELTVRAREAYGSLIDGVVFANDVAGNPMWIARDGSVRLVDHDNGSTVVQLAPDFRTLLADNVDD